MDEKGVVSREDRIRAMLSSNTVVSRQRLINTLITDIIEAESMLQFALESDKFHIVGAQSSIIVDKLKDLSIILDS